MDLTILDIVEDTVVDGPGLRLAVYAAGCRHHCPGCHNPQSWDKSNGHQTSVEALAGKILAEPFANVTFSGGDPLEQVEGFTLLAQRVKAQSRKTIWCYTGYRYDEVYESSRLSQILPYIDVLVDGPFCQSFYDESLLFRGSSNQRLVDVKTSLKTGRIALFQDLSRPHFL